MMMKIERLLSISQDKKGNEIARVQDLTKDQIKNIPKDKFRKAKSQRKEGRLEAEIYIIFKEDFNDSENNDSKIQSLEAELEEKNKTIKQLKDKSLAIDEDHQKEIKNLKQEHSAKVDELKKDLHDKDLEIEKTKTKYEKEIGLFREEIQKEINALELFDEDKHIKLSDHNSEINGIKDKITREIIVNNNNIHELEKGLSIGGFIKGKYKTPLKDLKEGIDHMKYIAQYSEKYENQALNINKKEKEDQ